MMFTTLLAFLDSLAELLPSIKTLFTSLANMFKSVDEPTLAKYAEAAAGNVQYAQDHEPAIRQWFGSTFKNIQDLQNAFPGIEKTLYVTKNVQADTGAPLHDALTHTQLAVTALKQNAAQK